MDAMVTIRTPRVAVFKTSFAEAGHVPFLQFASSLAVMVIVADFLPLFLQTAHIYTNEDLKWDALDVRHFKSSLVSDPEEIKMEHFNSSLV